MNPANAAGQKQGLIKTTLPKALGVKGNRKDEIEF